MLSIKIKQSCQVTIGYSSQAHRAEPERAVGRLALGAGERQVTAWTGGVSEVTAL